MSLEIVPGRRASQPAPRGYISTWGTSQGQPGYDRCVDLDGSGAVDFTNFTIFSNNFGAPCEPWPAP